MEKIKTFLASPEGAAGVVGLLRALFIVAIGLGVGLTQTQVDQALVTATSVMAAVSALMSVLSIFTVRSRANQEEVDAAVSGKVLVTNDAVASPDA